jgi:hypothetical protein
MEHVHTEADENDPAQGVLPSTVPAKGIEEQQIAKDYKDKPTAKSPNAAHLAWQWICKIVRNAWTFVKAPESTNVAIALATIVIAVATVFTYLEVHGGSAQTEKILPPTSALPKPWKQRLDRQAKRWMPV